MEYYAPQLIIEEYDTDNGVLNTTTAGAFFTTYEAIKYALNSSSSPTPEEKKKKNLLPAPIVHGLASSVAESVSCFILTPAEVLKQNAQMITARSPGLRGGSATLRVLAQFRSRPTRLWSGYTALVARNLPFTGIHFPMFEYLRARMVEWRRQYKAKAAGASQTQQKKTSNSDSDSDQLIERAGITAVAAGMAGSVAAVLTTPIDVVKTRIMLAAGGDDKQQKQQPANKGAEAERTRTRTKPGAWAVGRDIYYREGIKGLFSGGALRAGWTAIGLGLYLGAYEGGRFYLESRRRGRARAEEEEKLGVKGEEGKKKKEEAVI